MLSNFGILPPNVPFVPRVRIKCLKPDATIVPSLWKALPSLCLQCTCHHSFWVSSFIFLHPRNLFIRPGFTHWERYWTATELRNTLQYNTIAHGLEAFKKAEARVDFANKWIWDSNTLAACLMCNVLAFSGIINVNCLVNDKRLPPPIPPKDVVKLIESLQSPGKAELIPNLQKGGGDANYLHYGMSSLDCNHRNPKGRFICSVFGKAWLGRHGRFWRELDIHVVK